MRLGLLFTLIALALAPGLAAAQSTNAPAGQTGAQDKPLYSWVTRLLRKPDTSESAADDGFAVVFLRDQTDKRNEWVCKFLSARTAYYDPFNPTIHNGAVFYRYRPVYWPSQDSPAASANCPAWDYLGFGPIADQIPRKGGAPLILVYRNRADFPKKAWAVFDFTNLSDEETHENLLYFTSIFSQPSASWRKDKVVGLRKGQRFERWVGVLPGAIKRWMP